MRLIPICILIVCVSVMTGCGIQQDVSDSQDIIDAGVPDERSAYPRVYALGDSLTAGYQVPIQDSYPSQLEEILSDNGYQTDVVNGGHSGDTSAQLLARLDRSVADARSGDIVLLVIGANDGLQGLSLDQLRQNMRNSISRLQDQDLTVVLAGMQLPLNQGEEYRQEFTQIYPSLAQEFDIPLIPFFLEGVAANPALNLSDGIHPNTQGYSIIADTVFQFLKQNSLLSPLSNG